MANQKISQLPPATTPLAGTEELAIVQAGQTRRAPASAFGGGSAEATVAGFALTMVAQEDPSQAGDTGFDPGSFYGSLQGTVNGIAIVRLRHSLGSEEFSLVFAPDRDSNPVPEDFFDAIDIETDSGGTINLRTYLRSAATTQVISGERHFTWTDEASEAFFIDGSPYRATVYATLSSAAAPGAGRLFSPTPPTILFASNDGGVTWYFSVIPPQTGDGFRVAEITLYWIQSTSATVADILASTNRLIGVLPLEADEAGIVWQSAEYSLVARVVMEHQGNTYQLLSPIFLTPGVS